MLRTSKRSNRKTSKRVSRKTSKKGSRYTVGGVIKGALKIVLAAMALRFGITYYKVSKLYNELNTDPIFRSASINEKIGMLQDYVLLHGNNI